MTKRFFPQSSSIHSLDFTPSNIHNGNLHVVYKSDLSTLFTYLKVSESLYKEILASDSIGKAIDRLIKKADPAFLFVREPIEKTYAELADQFIASMVWNEASEETKTLVIGNIRGFVAFLEVKKKKIGARN